jgi:hypothetical protein
MLTILTAGTGLGVFLPGLFMQRALRQRGIESSVEVLESIYSDAALAERERAVAAFQADFRLAQFAHRRSRHDPGRFDADKLSAWAIGRGRRFATWSGFWLPLLSDLQARIDHCRIDAEVSASFDGCEPGPGDREIWLWHQDRLHWRLPVDERAPLAWHEREHRVLVHGGGWALGDFLGALDALPDAWEADVLLGQRSATLPRARGWHIAPEWRPWIGTPRFPPMAPCGSDDYSPADEHRAFELLRRARAVVSKPGGSTLIESLAAATPLLLLPAFGRAEAANAAVWKRLGFGLPLEDWLEGGARDGELEAMHERLAAARSGPSYLADLAAELADA